MKDILSDIRHAKKAVKEFIEAKNQLEKLLTSITGELVELPGYEACQDEIDDVLGSMEPDYDFINENLETMENIVLAEIVRKEGENAD